jgi:membrane protease YdiL (CAAX protease family)
MSDAEDDLPAGTEHPQIYAPLDGSPAPAVPGAPAAGSGGAVVPPVFLRPDQVAPAPGAGGPAIHDPDDFIRDDPAQRLWSWWVGPLAVFLGLAVATVLGLPLILALGPDEAQTFLDDHTGLAGLVQDGLWIVVAVITPLLAVHFLRPEHLGLRRAPNWPRAIGVFFGLLLVFYAAAAAYSAALGLDENSNKLLQDTGFGDSVSSDVALALLFTVAAPIAEELLFRGLLFRSLRDGFTRTFGRKSGIALGAIFSGLVFGGVHVGGGQNDFLPVLMFLGILLALAYQWSGTLYVGIAIHSLNNAIATGANADPSQSWVYGLIAAGPVLALLFAFLLARFIRRFVRSQPPRPSAPIFTDPPSVL